MQELSLIIFFFSFAPIKNLPSCCNWDHDDNSKKLYKKNLN